MSDQDQRTLERSAASPEELAHLYEARWRSGEWVERQVVVGPCSGVPRGEDDGGGIFEAIECQDGEIECRACDGGGQWPVCLNEWDEDESAPCEECGGTCMETCPTCNGSGVLTIPGRELAAYCGDEACRYLLGQCCPKHDAANQKDPPLNWGTGHAENPFEPWVRGLSRYGRETTIEAAYAVADLGVNVEFDGADGSIERGLATGCEAAREKLGEHPTRTAIQDALIPWALHVEEAPE